MCEITRIHYLDCRTPPPPSSFTVCTSFQATDLSANNPATAHIARIVSKFCKPYLNGPQDRSCAQLNNTDAEVRPSHCKRMSYRTISTYSSCVLS